MKLVIFILFVVSTKINSFKTDRKDVLNGRISSQGLSDIKKVIIGRDILIPCKVSSTSSGYAALILLYKDRSKSPILSIDSRKSRSLLQAKEWSSAAYKGRLKLELGPTGREGMLLQDVRQDDEGVFTCRTDFLMSPTIRNVTRIYVINPVKKLVIFLEGNGEKIPHQGVIGPFDLGTQLLLTCKAIGGKPSPKVTWWYNNTILDTVMESTIYGIARNTVHLPPLTLQDQYKELTCKAVNTEMFPTVSSSIIMKVKGSRKRVKIVANYPVEEPIRGPKIVTVSERDRLRLGCESLEENSSTNFVWSKESKTLEKSLDKVSFNTSSIEMKTQNLTMTVNFSDNEVLITCRGYNDQYTVLKYEEFQDSVQLNVLYKPRVVLTVQNADKEDIEEEDDIYLRCQIESNPPPTSVEWIFNGSKLHLPSLRGILGPTNASLVLLSVNSSSSGEYFCVVKNAKGVSVSNILYLRVKHTPICTKPKQLIASNLGQILNLTCPVKSYPQANLIKWAFSSTNTSSEISNYNVLPHLTSSEPMKYKVSSPNDFSSLLCWASNTVGQMTSPCSVSVVPTGKPEPVSYCDIVHIKLRNTENTENTFMRCSEGFDGGFHQSFYLSIWKLAENREHVLVDSYNSSSATFNISHLIAGEKYLFNITAWNCEGASNPVLLTYRKPFTQKEQTLMEDVSYSTSNQSVIPLIAAILGIIATLIMCFVSAFCYVRFRLCKKKIDRRTESYTKDLLQERVKAPLVSEGKSQSEFGENIYISGGRLVIGVKEKKRFCPIHSMKNFVEEENSHNLLKEKRKKTKDLNKQEKEYYLRKKFEKDFSSKTKSIASCSSPCLNKNKNIVDETLETNSSSSDDYGFDSKCSINTVLQRTIIS